ncbi:hypothetical protein MGSAQ_000326, partial [marine sediment metagenome]
LLALFSFVQMNYKSTKALIQVLGANGL